MKIHWTPIRLTPVVASVLLHIVAYGAIAMVPKFVSVRERVLIADLVEPDPAPPAPTVTPPRPKAPDRRPLIPPKPVETPMPAMTPPPVAPNVEETPPPPPPPPVAQEPAPASAAPAAPAVSAVPRVTAPMDAPVATGTDGVPMSGPVGPAVPAPTRPASPSAPSGPPVAALPSGGVTQTAVPRGGYQVRPTYPHNARRLGIQGTTLLSVFVAADGRVADVVVKESAGHPDLDQAAADAVKRWRFDPARRGSEAVAMWVLLPVEFRLR
jgi:periplasmic protein TonB